MKQLTNTEDRYSDIERLDLSDGKSVGQEVRPVAVSVGLAETGEGEGEAGGDQEHGVCHRQHDHQPSDRE